MELLQSSNSEDYYLIDDQPSTSSSHNNEFQALNIQSQKKSDIEPTTNSTPHNITFTPLNQPPTSIYTKLHLTSN